MPAAPAAPPPSTAPAQPAPSAPSPAPAKPAAPAPAPRTAAAPSASPSKPSKPGATAPPTKELIQPAKPAEATKPVDHFAESFEGIKKLSTREEGDPMEDEEAPAPSVEAKEEQPTPDKENTDEATEDEADVADQEKELQPDDPKLGKRPSPWTLVESYKKKYQAAEHELAELRSKANGELPKEHVERLTALQKRNEELEQHMRYLDYSKSNEFVDKYQKPYEEAWARAVSGLKGLKVQFTDPTSSEVVARDLTPQDIAALANMDPAAARLEIKNRFPEDAAEVRGYVDKIRDMAQAQNRALEEQKAKGGEWQSKQAEQAKAVHEANSKLWAQFSKEAAEKHEFLRPVEGDDERNMKLEKATAFVQKALASKANDPKLTEEQRAQVIKEHVAVRNRAIAYSVIMHENKVLKAQLAEKEAALKAFDESAPTDGNGKGKQGVTGGDISIEGVAAMLSKFGR